MTKKMLLLFLVTFIVETVLTFAIATAFSVRFIEVMGIVGAVCSAVIYLFTSGGGPLANFMTAQNAGATGLIREQERFVFKRGPIFLASLVYFVIGLILFVLLVKGIIPAT